jgi:hypothetical protein
LTLCDVPHSTLSIEESFAQESFGKWRESRDRRPESHPPQPADWMTAKALKQGLKLVPLKGSNRRLRRDGSNHDIVLAKRGIEKPLYRDASKLNKSSGGGSAGRPIGSCQAPQKKIAGARIREQSVDSWPHRAGPSCAEGLSLDEGETRNQSRNVRGLQTSANGFQRQLPNLGDPVGSAQEQVRKFKAVLSQGQLTNRSLSHISASMHRADGGRSERLTRQLP